MVVDTYLVGKNAQAKSQFSRAWPKISVRLVILYITSCIIVCCIGSPTVVVSYSVVCEAIFEKIM